MNPSFCTPQKTFSPSLRLLGGNEKPQQSLPNSGSSGGGSSSFRTPSSVRRGGRFHLLPVMSKTPITARLTKVVNPFEASLTERLHLPLICSPSLFHRPATPQLSSTQFEWTIDEVASLGPANVEPHETQFLIHTTDPELEARAQAAIASYFREKHVVPSPVNCQLRNAKILLSEESEAEEEVSVVKKIKTHDGVAQTILTFPPKLPKEVEELLKPFFSFNANQQQGQKPLDDSVGTHSNSSNASLRRKLFETSLNSEDLALSKHETDSEQILLEEVKAIRTPDLNLEIKVRTRHFGSPHDHNPMELSLTSLKKESFGSLSPILNHSSTPCRLSLSDKRSNRNHSSTSSLYRSTPERLIQRSLSINSVEMVSAHGSAMKVATCPELRRLDKDKCNNDSIDDMMHVSHWSDMNVTSSQSQDLQTTPVRRQNKSTSRKNLSRSFSHIFNEEFCNEISEEKTQHHLLNQIEDDDDDGVGDSLHHQREDCLPRRLLQRTLSSTTTAAASDSIYRTDSGFNDEDLSQNRRSFLGTATTTSATTSATPSNDVFMRSYLA